MCFRIRPVCFTLPAGIGRFGGTVAKFWSVQMEHMEAAPTAPACKNSFPRCHTHLHLSNERVLHFSVLVAVIEVCKQLTKCCIESSANFRVSVLMYHSDKPPGKYTRLKREKKVGNETILEQKRKQHITHPKPIKNKTKTNKKKTKKKSQPRVRNLPSALTHKFYRTLAFVAF